MNVDPVMPKRRVVMNCLERRESGQRLGAEEDSVAQTLNQM